MPVSTPRTEGETLEARLSGCGSHSCVIARPSGQGNNGRCRCDERALRRALRTLTAERDALQARNISIRKSCKSDIEGLLAEANLLQRAVCFYEDGNKMAMSKNVEIARAVDRAFERIGFP